VNPTSWTATALEAAFVVLIIMFVVSLLELNGARLNRVASIIFALIMGEIAGVASLLISSTHWHLEVRLALAYAVVLTAFGIGLVARDLIRDYALMSLVNCWID